MYEIRKFIGVAIYVVGHVLVVFSDVHAGDRAGTLSFFLIIAYWFNIILYYELAGLRNLSLFGRTSSSFELVQFFYSTWYQHSYVRCILVLVVYLCEGCAMLVLYTICFQVPVFPRWKCSGERRCACNSGLHALYHLQC